MGEYKALGLNMAYERPNDGNQWYNTNPNDLTSREDIDRYMKGYNDTSCFWITWKEKLSSIKAVKTWTMHGSRRLINNTEGQTPRINFDKVRPLSDEEKAIALHTVDDLITNNFMTNRGPEMESIIHRTLVQPMWRCRWWQGSMEGTPVKRAPGAMSFKHNTFRLWGYYGYEKGFLGYASNKYKQESKQAGHATLGMITSLKRFLMGNSVPLKTGRKPTSMKW